MNPIIIAPSILSADFANLEKECKDVLDCGADWLHVDVMDGHFVPNLTIGPAVVTSIRKALPDAFLDCHLMVSNPFKWITAFAEAGASSITFHFESFSNTQAALALINIIRTHKCKAAMAIKPVTQIDEVKDLLPHLDMLLVMTVEPGFGGQSIILECLDKIPLIKEKYPALLVQVDGGINTENYHLALSKGADVLVAGTAIYKSSNRAETIKLLKTRK